MEVISSKAKALWNVQEENIWPSVISDSLVDESVPFGSLQFCLKSRDVLGSIPEVYDKLKKEAEKMVVPIARTVSEDVLNYLIPYAIEPVLRRFRDTEEIPTIEKLENALTIELNRDVHKDNIRKLADNAAKSKAMSNKEGFQKVITEFLEKLYDREAGDASWNWSTNIDLETVSDGSFTKAICQAVAKAMEDSVLEIVVGLMLVLTAILWVTVGFALEIVDGAKELWRKATWTEDQWAQWEREQEQKKLQAEQEKKQKELEERQKVRKPSERKKIYKKVIENQDTQSDLRYAVEKKVSEQLEGKCNENGFGVPEAYLEQLRVDICNAVYTGL